MFCPNCGHKVSNADSFCPNCGKKLSHQTQKANDSGNKNEQSGRFCFCPNCGAELPEYGEFCPKCGTRVRNENTEKIKKIGNEGAAKVREAAGKGAKKVSEAADKGTEKVTEAVHTGAEKMADFKKKSSQKVSAAHATVEQKIKKIKWKKRYTIAAIAVIAAVAVLIAFINRPRSNYKTAIDNYVELLNMVLASEITDTKDIERALELLLPASITRDSSNFISCIQSAEKESPALREDIEKRLGRLTDEIVETKGYINGKCKLKKVNSAERLDQNEFADYQTKIQEGLSGLGKEIDIIDIFYGNISEGTKQKMFDSYNNLNSDFSSMQVSDGYNVNYTLSIDGTTQTESMNVICVDGSWVLTDLFDYVL